MELLGFFYEKAEDKIPAYGFPISRELLDKGYIQKDSEVGEPMWYVKHAIVWIILDINGVRKKYNIYNNIMAIYPDRQRITLKLAQKVIAEIIEGKIELTFREGKPFLIRKNR